MSLVPSPSAQPPLPSPVTLLSTVVGPDNGRGTPGPVETTSVPRPIRPSNNGSHSSSTQLAIVLSLIFGLLIITGLVIYLVRGHFIRKRARGEEISPARARLANANLFHFSWNVDKNNNTNLTTVPTTSKRSRPHNLKISRPINFEHLESGVLGFSEHSDERKGVGLYTVPVQPAPVASRSASSEEEDTHYTIVGNGLMRSPSDRMKQKYADLLTLESGLGSHMETMKNSRRPVQPI